MPEVEVSPGRVTDAAVAAAHHAAELERRVAGLNGLVTRTVGTDWRGAGAEAFASDYSEWLSGAHDVHDALLRVAELLAGAGDVYESTEQAVTRASRTAGALSAAPGKA